MRDYLVTEDSIFQRLPAELDQKQRLILDGIRYSIDITDHAFLTLTQVLEEFSIREVDEKVPKAYTIAFSNAWVMVDSIARLSKLLNLIGANREAEIGKFRTGADTENVRKLRNHVQHLDERFDSSVTKQNLVKNMRPTWGTISWVHLPTNFVETRIFSLHTIVAGSTQQTNADIPMPKAETPVRLPVDLISLSAHGHIVSLTNIHDALAHLVRFFEKVLSPQFADAPTAINDFHMKMVIRSPKE